MLHCSSGGCSRRATGPTRIKLARRDALAPCDSFCRGDLPANEGWRGACSIRASREHEQQPGSQSPAILAPQQYVLASRILMDDAALSHPVGIELAYELLPRHSLAPPPAASMASWASTLRRFRQDEAVLLNP